MPAPNTISVVTPVHPARLRSGLFADCVGSVALQTLLPEAHCVAIDTERAGAAATRDRALRMASTQWVAFLDSDDMFLARHLELMLRHALDREADFVYSWFKVWQQAPSQGVDRILEDDPIFPVTHYLNDFDPDDPIETTVTTLVRTELAQSVGFVPLDRGHDANSGEDYNFLLGCLKAGAKVSHLKRRTWLWRHWSLRDGAPGNTSGLPTKGDAV